MPAELQVSKVDAIDALFQYVKNEPTGLVSIQDFVEVRLESPVPSLLAPHDSHLQ